MHTNLVAGDENSRRILKGEDVDMKFNRHHDILMRLSLLPHKIVAFNDEGVSHVTEFVLHELCGPQCFNLKKAA